MDQRTPGGAADPNKAQSEQPSRSQGDRKSHEELFAEFWALRQEANDYRDRFEKALPEAEQKALEDGRLEYGVLERLVEEERARVNHNKSRWERLQEFMQTLPNKGRAIGAAAIFLVAGGLVVFALLAGDHSIFPDSLVA